MTADQTNSLRMLTGYNTFDSDLCELTPTLEGCLALGQNDIQDAGAIGEFYYTGGDDEVQGVTEGLGPDNDAALATELESQLGTDLPLGYNGPDLAGGMKIAPNTETQFLRKIVSDQLVIHDYLGANPVCTNPVTCATALYTPVPSTESWHYSYNHWVEDDPNVGDGAFSSPGAFGMYPWIDSTKTYRRSRASVVRQRRLHPIGLLRKEDSEGLPDRRRAIIPAALCRVQRFERDASILFYFGPGERRFDLRGGGIGHPDQGWIGAQGTRQEGNYFGG